MADLSDIALIDGSAIGRRKARLTWDICSTMSRVGFFRIDDDDTRVEL